MLNKVEGNVANFREIRSPVVLDIEKKFYERNESFRQNLVSAASDGSQTSSQIVLLHLENIENLLGIRNDADTFEHKLNTSYISNTHIMRFYLKSLFLNLMMLHAIKNPTYPIQFQNPHDALTLLQSVSRSYEIHIPRPISEKLLNIIPRNFRFIQAMSYLEEAEGYWFKLGSSSYGASLAQHGQTLQFFQMDGHNEHLKNVFGLLHDLWEVEKWVSENGNDICYREARDKIYECLTTGALSLDLSGRGLTSFPLCSHAGALRKLKILDLSENQLTQIPLSVRQAWSLVSLNLDNNQIQSLSLPEELPTFQRTPEFKLSIRQNPLQNLNGLADYVMKKARQCRIARLPLHERHPHAELPQFRMELSLSNKEVIANWPPPEATSSRRPICGIVRISEEIQQKDNKLDQDQTLSTMQAGAASHRNRRKFPKIHPQLLGQLQGTPLGKK